MITADGEDDKQAWSEVNEHVEALARHAKLMSKAGQLAVEVLLDEVVRAETILEWL